MYRSETIRCTCPKYRDCYSQQCPLDIEGDVKIILPGNECLVRAVTRKRIAAVHSDTLLMYGGLTKAEYYSEFNKLQKKETWAQLSAMRASAKQRAQERKEAKERVKLIERFKVAVQDLSNEDLSLLVDDVDTILHEVVKIKLYSSPR